jgi:hypothetical protein
MVTAKGMGGSLWSGAVAGRAFPVDPAQLRAEVEAMVDAVRGALVDRFGAGIRGLSFKGSAQKRWDTQIDYLPELSDVDIHFRTDGATSAALADLDTALALHAEIGRRFTDGCPDPTHVPRPQLIDADEIERLADYVPPPAGTVRTLVGPEPGPVRIDEEQVRVGDARRLLAAGDPQFLAKAVADLIERPSHHLFPAVRALSWRVAPVAPRVVNVLGGGFATAWSANRTEAVRLLVGLGQDALADQVMSFYEAAWVAYASGWRDGDAGRAAFAAGIRALRLGASLVPENFFGGPVDPGEARS